MFEIEKLAATRQERSKIREGITCLHQINDISKDVTFCTTITINGLLKGDGTIEIYEGKDLLPDIQADCIAAALQVQPTDI